MPIQKPIVKIDMDWDRSSATLELVMSLCERVHENEIIASAEVAELLDAWIDSAQDHRSDGLSNLLKTLKRQSVEIRRLRGE